LELELELALRDLAEWFQTKKFEESRTKVWSEEMLLVREIDAKRIWSVREHEGPRRRERVFARLRGIRLSILERKFPFLRCALWLVGRSVGASLRRRAGPIEMRCRQGAFHHIRAISPEKKNDRKKQNK